MQARNGDAVAAAETFERAVREAGPDAVHVKDYHESTGGMRQAALLAIVKGKAEVGQEKAALKWAKKEFSPVLKARAFLDVAETILARQRGKGGQQD